MRIVNTVFICFLSCLLTGCWDRVELEEQAYVIAIGVDVGKIHDYLVTFEIANPKIGARDVGSEGNKPPTEVITIDAPDVLSLRDTANASVSRRISLSHAKVIIVSEKLAKTDKFSKMILPIMRDRDIRRNVDLMICREDASEFIRTNNPKLESRNHKFYELMANRWKETALVPVSNLNRFYARTVGRGGLFIASYASAREPSTGTKGYEDNYKAGQISKEGGNPTQIIGSAVIKDGLMIGTLTGEETRFSLNLRPVSKVSSMMTTFPDPLSEEERIVARLTRRRNHKVRMDLNGDYPKMDIDIYMNVEILAIPSFIDYVEDLDKQKILKLSIEEYLNKGAKSLIKKTQREFKADPFLWSTYARKQFLTSQEYAAYGWMDKYPRAKINVSHHVNIIDFGIQNRPPKIEKAKD
jgi:spore germination protein KC